MDLDKLRVEDRQPTGLLCTYLRSAGLEVEMEGAADEGRPYSEIELRVQGSVEGVARAVSGLYGYGSTISPFGATCQEYSITEERACDDLSQMHMRVRLGDVRTLLRVEVEQTGQHSYDELLRAFLVERSYRQQPVNWLQQEIPGFEPKAAPGPVVSQRDLESFCGCTVPLVVRA
ncbi:hypothetical protein HY642_03115 [Candidatus Woesearchaeota archaeon]|nr:hypothetical protein [Candidatus Woesearchaeota archaeon]